LVGGRGQGGELIECNGETDELTEDGVGEADVGCGGEEEEVCEPGLDG
jgi:hypothetical protein